MICGPGIPGSFDSFKIFTYQNNLLISKVTMGIYKISENEIACLKIQFEVFKKLDMSQKLLQTFELSENIQDITKSEIQKDHPEYNQKQIVHLFLKRILDKKLHHKI